jgi:hypothetical protein
MFDDQEHQERQVVHVIQKGPRVEIRVSRSTFKGKHFLDLRTFVTNRAGELVPTRKGVTVPLELLGELELAVRSLRAAVGPGPDRGE